MSIKKIEFFDYLVIGLKEFLSQEKKYPYPDLLHFAMNALCLEMEGSIPFPKTMNGFLHLLEEPLKDWCPNSLISKEFDRDFGLIDEGDLSEEANDYIDEVLLNKEKISENLSTILKQLKIENSQFTRILAKLRNIDDSNPDKVQQEYILLRTFLIQNQFTTIDRIRTTFLQTKYISTEEIGGLYEDCYENENWYCDRCGMLTEKHGRLQGIKTHLCGNHHPDLSFVRKIQWEKGLLQIKEGIHRRVCFPGIPEINLYFALEELKKKYPNFLQEVKLYPNLDRYDLQLHFGDGVVWAIDIKDVRDPYKLAKNLTGLYSEGSLRYDESFYVISDRCIQNTPNYLGIVRQQAKNLPNATSLISDKFFRDKVNSKIIELQKGGTI